MKNVLVIVYYFPPMGGSGVQRPLKFVKYLREFGWNPVVLCPEPGMYHTFDSSLKQELEDLDIEVHRVKGNTPLHNLGQKKILLPSFLESILRKISTFFWLPDNKIGWIRPGLDKAKQIIASKKIDLIFASAPPYSNLMIGKALKEEFNIPFVADLRDEWLESHLLNYPTSWHYSKMKDLEKTILGSADRIITINKYIANAIHLRGVNKEKPAIIAQGFDHEDFKDEIPINKGGNRITFLYSGTFYPESGPEYFLEAFAQLFSANPELKLIIELQFQGVIKDEYLRLIEEKGLNASVTIFGQLDHATAVKNLKNADILWLNNTHSKNSQILSLGKTYEYMAALKPILALIPNGDIKDKIEEYGASYISNPKDIESIKVQILNVISDLKTGQIAEPNVKFVQKYSRKELTGELASIFNVISP